MADTYVIDPRVFLHALRSRTTPAHGLLSNIDRFPARLVVSLPLVLEYEAMARARSRTLGLTHADIDAVLDYLCANARPQRLSYLWRPILDDRLADMTLQAAAEGACRFLVTGVMGVGPHALEFGIRTLAAAAFVQVMQTRAHRR